jgi:hypothetical protein
MLLLVTQAAQKLMRAGFPIRQKQHTLTGRGGSSAHHRGRCYLTIVNFSETAAERPPGELVAVTVTV